MERLVDGSWMSCTEADLVDGDIYRIPVGNGGWQQQVFKAITPNAIRIIAPGSFQRRFNGAAQNVRKLIRESTDDNVIDLREDLAAAAYVDLDDQYTVAGINYLGSLGWLTSEEVEAMLSDGTEREKYNGPL